MSFLNPFWRTWRSPPAPPPCHHYYVYRSHTCTQCGKGWPYPYEPVYTPHLLRNGKLIPARIVGDRLIPLEGFDAT